MVFVMRSSEASIRPVAVNKVIKADDVWAFKTAQSIINSAESRRKEIETAAVLAFEAEQRRGYLVGCEQARIEQSENMIDIISRTVDYFGKVEAQMVDLVLEAVRRIVNDFNEREKVGKVVTNCLALVRNQQQITIRIHPDQVDGISLNIKDFQKKFPTIEQIEVVPDHHLAEDACIIESDIGRVEASLSGQIEALRTTMERVFAGAR